MYAGEGAPASLESSIVAIPCGLGILAEDDAFEKDSLIMITMVKSQSAKGQRVTLK